MPILSSEEFINEESDRLRRGEGTISSLINSNTSAGFGHETVQDTVSHSLKNDEYIGFIEIDGQIVASGFGKEDSKSVAKTMYIHSFAVNADWRGKQMCQKIVGQFIKKFGKNYILYLTVRTAEGNVNEHAIRCYEKNDFVMLPEVYRDHYDGKNNAMIRVPMKPTYSKKVQRRPTSRRPTPRRPTSRRHTSRSKRRVKVGGSQLY